MFPLTRLHHEMYIVGYTILLSTCLSVKMYHKKNIVTQIDNIHSNFSTWDFRRRLLLLGVAFTPHWHAHWTIGSVFQKTRPVSPYMVIVWKVDWHQAAAAKLPGHGGRYSVTEKRRQSYDSFHSSWKGILRYKWLIGKLKDVRVGFWRKQRRNGRG